MVKDIEIKAPAGLTPALILCALLSADLVLLLWGAKSHLPPVIIGAILMILVLSTLLGGLFMVNPNESRVVQLFGRYMGTVNEPGLRWANPFYTKTSISRRVRNFETSRVKVNDLRGNPVDIACVVVWQVVDCAEATFEVNDYVDYVHVQSESAVRNLARAYPYDSYGDEGISLSGDTGEVSHRLQEEIQQRLEKAGVRVIEARLSHLAYAQEIAAAMLQRQQASAVVAARSQIVEGAVGMVDMALEMLSRKQIVTLDEERKAAMVSNLLVVLCSDRHTQPVVNTGTLYN
ncbi:MAG: SPFH domain-containing protein [Candidatus Delongbacteria bacterium]|nr:SPFH domain-containing protein [Candidatus Cloacimonadota bacterium]MCB9472662.1 SPFH domain-containing protein [Candidatus Delongbacteria bacterium]